MDRTKRAFLTVTIYLLTLSFVSGAVFTSDACAAYRRGYVAAKGVVKGPNGMPIWAVYAEDGTIVEDIGEAFGEPLQDAVVMSASVYKGYVALYQSVASQYGQEMEVLSREDYEQRTFIKPGTTNEALVKPSLKKSTNSIVVRNSGIAFYDSSSLILLESPIDLNRIETIYDTDKSVLVSPKGIVVKVSKNNIGYRAAYFTPKGSTEHETAPYNDQILSGKDDMIGYDDAEDQLWGPIAGASVYAHVYGPAYTDDNGFFEVGVPVGVDYRMQAKLRYNVFDPQGAFAGIYLRTHRCYESPYSGVSFRLKIKFPIDAAMVAGYAILRNPFIAGDPTANRVMFADTTQYRYVAPVSEAADPVGNRVADIAPDFTDQGLLTQINQEDIENTDIYIYRVSNDQLIVSREGLVDHEFVPMFGTGQDQGTISFHMLIRGAASIYGDNGFTTLWTFDHFQEATNINEMFRQYRADHLRPGEQLKVILVNRATGYIGTGIGTVGNPVGIGEASNLIYSNDITVNFDRILLQPPNLRIKSERKFKVKAGLTKGDIYENLIGFEGSGLSDDTFVAVSTEWYDHDGTPLPADLPGYTGRLAKVVGKNQLKAVGGMLANFEIKPGKHLQLVRLTQKQIDNDHYYIHVSGEPPQGNPDFSEIGAAVEGPLAYRPKHYVPVQVPIYDEAATSVLKAAYTEAVKADEDTMDLTPPEPAYRWVYRPEMQFSVFDLDQDKMQFNTIDDNGQVHNIQLLDPVPVLPGSDPIQLFYALIGSDFPVLEPFGPGRTLVFAIGDHELEAVVGQDQTLTFTNLEDVNLLEAEDYLAVRLYQNGDDANILWEYAFGLLEVKPNTIPLDGVVRAKITIGIKEDNIPHFVNPNNMPAFTIGSNVCGDVRQDEFDTRTFYCTPPPSPNGSEGKFDLTIKGIVVRSIPELAEGRPLLLSDFIEYTDDSEIGINKFSESISVSIEEATSLAAFKKKEEGLTGDETAEIFMDHMGSQANVGMVLMKAFLHDKEITDSVKAQFDSLKSSNNSLTVSKLQELGALFVSSGGSAIASGINIIAIDSKAVEIDGDVAMFVISREMALPTPLTVNFTISGSAINGLDYELLTNSIVIPENESQIGFKIVPLNDSLTEASEDVVITLTPDSEYQIGPYPEASVEIFDDYLNIGSNKSFRHTPDMSNQNEPESIANTSLDVFNRVSNWLKENSSNGIVQSVYADTQSLSFVPPTLGSATFFSDVEAWMQQTSNEIYVGTVGYSTYAVIKANDFNLATKTYTTKGMTIDNAIADNSNAKIIINGAFFNWDGKEPLVTSGVVYNNRVIQPSSTNPILESWKAATVRYWFGQDRTIQDASWGLSYLFGGQGNPPAIDAAIGGLVSCIWPNELGVSQKVTLDMDKDIHTYMAYVGPAWTGYGMIGIDRNTAMIIILCKKHLRPQDFFAVQDLLFDSGVDEAVVTDGGSSVALYIDGKKYVVGSRHGSGYWAPLPQMTVTSYFVFIPR